MSIKKIAIIGGGNIGVAIREGLIKTKYFHPDFLTVTRRKGQLIEYLKKDTITTHSDNIKAINEAELVIIAVQPNQVFGVLDEIKDSLDIKIHTLVSIVTGVTLQEIEDRIGKKLPMFRVMPNTAIAICESMTFISKKNTSEEQENMVNDIFEHLGKVIVINEKSMLAATVLGSCGIAYALRFVRAASQGGIEIGFDASVAQEIAAQTVKGAASLLIERGLHPEREIDKVTTPRGCTIAGLNEMEHQGFSSALIKGIMTSFNKIN